MQTVRTTLRESEEFYVGQRIAVVQPLFNRLDGQAAGGLVVSLSAKKPDGSVVMLGLMPEDPDSPGTYSGSFVPDMHGQWTVTVECANPEWISRRPIFVRTST